MKISQKFPQKIFDFLGHQKPPVFESYEFLEPSNAKRLERSNMKCLASEKIVDFFDDHETKGFDDTKNCQKSMIFDACKKFSIFYGCKTEGFANIENSMNFRMLCFS